jgi:hypothetical protein
MTPELRFGHRRQDDASRSAEPTTPQPLVSQASDRPAQRPPDQAGAEAASPEREEVEQEIARIKQANCEGARRNLAKLEAFARIRVRGEDGQERMLTDEEKQQRLQQERITISENCPGGG